MKKILAYILPLSILFLSCTDHISEELEPEWQYESPPQLGVSGEHLLLLDQQIKRGLVGNVNSLLILKNEKVIFENYYNGYGPGSMINLGRATQSIFTLFSGKVLDEYEIPGDTLIINYFPEYTHLFENIPQKDKIQLQHLIDYKSGFWWNDWDTNQIPENSDELKMTSSSDWVEYVLNTRMIREPGMEYSYNSGHSILLSDIFEQHLDQSLIDYFENRFFSPLGINKWEWSNTPKGRLNTNDGLSLNTSAMAKIGELILNRGITNKGEVLVTERWINSLRRVFDQTNYYWIGPTWYRFYPTNEIIPNQFANDVMFSWGEGGKFIMVVPHQEMVIVLNADCETIIQEQELFSFIGDYIFAATSQPAP